MSEKYLKSEFLKETIKIGRRGQITIPKSVRILESLKRGDKLQLVRQPTGTMYITKVPKEKDPIDRILEITSKYPKFNFEKAWKEVQEERRRSER